MGKVIKFVTGSEAEPVLGCGVNPDIVFNPYAISCLPTSNTCIKKLTCLLETTCPKIARKVMSSLIMHLIPTFLVAFTSRVNGTE